VVRWASIRYIYSYVFNYISWIVFLLWLLSRFHGIEIGWSYDELKKPFLFWIDSYYIGMKTNCFRCLKSSEEDYNWIQWIVKPILLGWFFWNYCFNIALSLMQAISMSNHCLHYVMTLKWCHGQSNENVSYPSEDLWLEWERSKISFSYGYFIVKVTNSH